MAGCTHATERRNIGYCRHCDPCPYTVGKRVCVAGNRGHAGPHDWPAPGKRTEYPTPREVFDRELNELRESMYDAVRVSPFVRRAMAAELPAKETYR